MSAHWSTNFIVGCIVLPVLLVALTVATFFTARNLVRICRKRRQGVRRYDADPVFTIALLSGLCLALLGLLLGSLAGFYPYASRYHRYVPVSGQVTSLGNTISGVSGSYTLGINGEARYLCQDTRCSLLHVGQFVHLSCIVQFVRIGTDYDNCEFVSVDS